IVGFPGETDEEFEETYTFIESLPFSYLHVFTYSERENTPAAEYKDAVPMRIRKIRNARLRDLSERKRSMFYASQRDTEHIIIPESYDAITGLWKGWTENYVRCQFPADEHLELIPYRIALHSIDEHGLMKGELIDTPIINQRFYPLTIL
ncbi:MAG: hypothetical protein RIT37_1409, partial [Bacteroidota bacterium]